MVVVERRSLWRAGWPLLEVRLLLGFLFEMVVKTETSLNNDQLGGFKRNTKLK